MNQMKEAEYHTHVQTYRGFVRTATYCAALVAVVLALMATFLT